MLANISNRAPIICALLVALLTFCLQILIKTSILKVKTSFWRSIAIFIIIGRQNAQKEQ